MVGYSAELARMRYARAHLFVRGNIILNCNGKNMELTRKIKMTEMYLNGV